MIKVGRPGLHLTKYHNIGQINYFGDITNKKLELDVLFTVHGHTTDTLNTVRRLLQHLYYSFNNIN